MARKDDPRVTDLSRYRRAREQARRAPPRRPQAPSERMLGGRRNAGVILAIVAVVLLALWIGPIFL
jgi:hypothetical protein